MFSGNPAGRRRQRMSFENQDGFIIDGQYTSLIGGIVSERATDVISLYFPRLVLRTLLWLLRLAPPSSPGARKWSTQVAIIRIGVGSAPSEQQKMRRIGGWGSELREWKQSVKALHEASKLAH
ncbi:hypothetical protein Moror_15953 [Moniliophthora roreri MCA 2997]|uniref:Uncharacterized protein n=1 Tax=Moniliophthora roreri (strain MCA 2997) TaxID=1381753 RepID=V2XJW0_MONRO|nr:hypothetical protein Moror_15953 [Moniliophthora roreri MCA 2997]